MPDEARLAAKAARLHYVDDGKPGYTRRQTKDGVEFVRPDGAVLRDEAEIARLRKLAIPPAYTDVWICLDPRGHLQAVGRDARGRKQYRYHADWRAVRDEAKYGRMLVFGKTLPLIRARVAKDLSRPGLPRSKVLATLVSLLEKTMMRIGNEDYARSNKSYGLSTLRNRHARVKGSALVLDFRAKHGIRQHIELTDRRLARIVGRLQDLPGQELFQYVDEDGERHGVSSQDVNDYLREIGGEEITAKDFRTWAATNLAALALREFEQVDSEAKAKKNVLRAIEHVASVLGNTPTICRKCYIHPRVFDGYLDGSLVDALRQRAESELVPERAAAEGLSADELAVMAFLGRTLDKAAGKPRARRKAA